MERPRRFGVPWFGFPRSASVFLGDVGHTFRDTPRANWCPPFGRLGGVRCRHRSAAWVVLTWSKVGPAPVTCNVQTKRVFNMVVLASPLDTKKTRRGGRVPCSVVYLLRLERQRSVGPTLAGRPCAQHVPVLVTNHTVRTNFVCGDGRWKHCFDLLACFL